MNINENETPSPWMTRKRRRRNISELDVSTLAKLDRAAGPVAGPFSRSRGSKICTGPQILNRWIDGPARTAGGGVTQCSGDIKKRPDFSPSVFEFGSRERLSAARDAEFQRRFQFNPDQRENPRKYRSA